MEEIKKTFIITSVINFSKKKLSYSDSRSVYTPQERTVQTFKTIASIREKVPFASVILVEMGNKKKIDSTIINAVDKYIFVGNNWLVKWACNSEHKGFGEAMGLLIASKSSIITGTDIYFKISGRYFLNNHFDITKWEGKHFCCKQYGSGISTRLYSFDASIFHDWQIVLKKSLYQLWRGNSIEDIMMRYIPENKIKTIQLLGLSGFIAPNAEFLSE